MKNIQLYRKLSQLIFMVLLIVGIYMNLRMVIMIVLPVAFVFGNFFCGWICPYGFLQEIFGWIGSKLFKKKYKMPKAIQKYLKYSRYILAIISVTGIFSIFFETINAYGTFMSIFMDSFTMGIATFVMFSFAVISIVFERPYCNYFCSEGIKYGVFSFTRIFSIKRNENTCIGCGKCDKVCPMNIEISTKPHVRNAQCINCLQCISACPVKGTLSYHRVPFPKPKK